MVDGTASVRKKLAQAGGRTFGRAMAAFERAMITMDSSNVIAEVDNLSDLSDEESDSM